MKFKLKVAERQEEIIKIKTDYIKLAEAFGGKGYKATTIAEFKKAFEQALQNKNCPSVIECVIDRDEKVLPMIPPGGSFDDIIVD